MNVPLSEQVLARLDKLSELYHRLLLVVAPSGSGKSRALLEVAERTKAPLVNLNLEVSKRLLDLTRAGAYPSRHDGPVKSEDLSTGNTLITLQIRL